MPDVRIKASGRIGPAMDSEMRGDRWGRMCGQWEGFLRFWGISDSPKKEGSHVFPSFPVAKLQRFQFVKPVHVALEPDVSGSSGGFRARIHPCLRGDIWISVKGLRFSPIAGFVWWLGDLNPWFLRVNGKPPIQTKITLFES